MSNLPANIRVHKAQCDTCVFRAECDGGIHLAEGRRAEIAQKCLSGVNQLCHTDADETICRGGRDYMLTMWHRIGLIAAPTNAALRRVMVAMGVVPGKHVEGTGNP